MRNFHHTCKFSTQTINLSEVWPRQIVVIGKPFNLMMPLENVLKTSLQDVLKTFLQDVLKTFWRRLEDIWPRRIYWSWSRRLEDVFWRRLVRANIFVLIKTFWRRLHQDECLLGNKALNQLQSQGHCLHIRQPLDWG